MLAGTPDTTPGTTPDVAPDAAPEVAPDVATAPPPADAPTTTAVVASQGPVPGAAGVLPQTGPTIDGVVPLASVLLAVGTAVALLAAPRHRADRSARRGGPRPAMIRVRRR